ncbi:uncharacterized protein IL334_000911 [Kwoniella shivajii]|uniref:Glycerol-1-phosphatase n=1 Tax=Kwoniella shivajii TaxID=564305 RepID=A0ABZ1CQH0_9TREE|nr:hypothetical protein IL334_000911 [Kwoniella shivajii]
MTWEIKAGVMGKTSLMAAEYILSHFPKAKEDFTPEQWIEEGNKQREELFRKVEPMRGAAALVKGLFDAGIPIALATGSTYENFQYKTTHLPHIFSLFPPSCIITGDSKLVKPGRGKPQPDVFLVAAQSLGRDVGTADECTPAQKEERSKAIVFEDARPGVMAGVAAGMNVIWVPDAELLALDPSTTYGAKQVLAHLEEWNPQEWGLPPLEGFNHHPPAASEGQ